MDVKVETLPPMRVACVRHTGPYNECNPAWETLFQHAGQQGWMSPETQCLGLCHDDPDTTPDEKIRYDACVTVGPDAQASDPVKLAELPGGEYATFIHKGPFDQIAASYKQFYSDWLPSSGREQAAAPHIEFYLNDPKSTPPEKLETRVCVPLK